MSLSWPNGNYQMMNFLYSTEIYMLYNHLLHHDRITISNGGWGIIIWSLDRQRMCNSCKTLCWARSINFLFIKVCTKWFNSDRNYEFTVYRIVAYGMKRRWFLTVLHYFNVVKLFTLYWSRAPINETTSPTGLTSLDWKRKLYSL